MLKVMIKILNLTLHSKLVRKKLVRKKLKTRYLRHMLLVILTVKKMLERLTKKNCKKQVKQSETEFRVEKVIQKKSDALYVNWKGYANSLNNWTDKNDVL